MNSAVKVAVQEDAQQHARRSNGALTAVFTLATFALVVLGWQTRNEYYLTAEHGTGYALGIIGGLMMLLLLLYPLRKRLRFMHHWLPVRHWFRVHMILGVLGPLCILYHCNFHPGATNSNVALACMALMVASGVVGRFIYARIHHGLYGQRATLQELQRSRIFVEQQLSADAERLPAEVREQLKALEVVALQRRSVAGNIVRALTFGLFSRWSQWRMGALLSGGERAAARAHVAAYLDALRRIAGFTFFERLFSLWHVLHMPIFFMLVITGLVHVYAVHFY
jgi:hypothetical protein